MILPHPLHSIEICVEILSKTKLFRPKTATPYNVEPFERILRGLFKAQSPNKFSSFLDLKNHSSRFRLFAREFRRFRFLFSGSACFSKLASPGNLQSWVKYYGNLEVLEKNFGGQNSMLWRGWRYIRELFCQTWSKEIPPPGVSYLLSSLTKNPEEEEPPRRICSRCFDGGPVSAGSWLGNIGCPGKYEKPAGVVSFDQILSLSLSNWAKKAKWACLALCAKLPKGMFANEKVEKK